MYTQTAGATNEAENNEMSFNIIFDRKGLFNVGKQKNDD